MPEETESANGPARWYYPQIWILCLIIFVATPYGGVAIGSIVFLALMAACLWAAVSRKAYEKKKANYPSLTRRKYVLNMLILPCLVPLVIFGILVAVGYQ